MLPPALMVLFSKNHACINLIHRSDHVNWIYYVLTVAPNLQRSCSDCKNVHNIWARGHFAPRTFCPRTFCPNFCKNSGHFTPRHFAPVFLRFLWYNWFRGCESVRWCKIGGKWWNVMQNVCKTVQNSVKSSQHGLAFCLNHEFHIINNHPHNDLN